MNDNYSNPDARIEAQLDREFDKKGSSRMMRAGLVGGVSDGVELQDRIDAAIGRQFRPPSAMPPPLGQSFGDGAYSEPAPAQVAADSSSSVRISRAGFSAVRRWLAAAAVLLMLGAAWRGWQWSVAAAAPRLDSAYTHAVSGEAVHWLSRDAQHLPELSTRRLRARLTIEETSAKASLLGIIDLPEMPDSLGLLAEANGEMIVLIMRPTRVRTVFPARETRLYTHVRELDAVTLYEVSFLSQSALLDAVLGEGCRSEIIFVPATDR